MNSYRPQALVCILVVLCPLALVAAQETQPTPGYDERLVSARQYVETSEKYLYHDRLQRGMAGYGVTVMAGTQRVRFELEIVSVMTNWGPHQDVILARLHGLDLENTSIIAGMSGSPCYVNVDGTDRMIGAVAYGWMAQKGSLCGIQPITQMLAAAGVGRTESSGRGAAPQSTGRRPSTQRLQKAVLDPARQDFSRLLLPQRDSAGSPSAVLSPLLTPLMVSGISPRSMDQLSALCGQFGLAGLMPVQAGGVGEAMLDEDAAATELVPGGSISVQLATGDADFNAVGTVTDVADGRVLAFGHSFFGDTEVELPMGPAYVHTVVAGVLRSFKLASGLEPVGTLQRDEAVGVVGHIGEPPPMIPMTVEITWPEGTDGAPSVQRFSYQLAKHRLWTPVLASMLSQDASWGWRDTPELHTVRHTVTVDFGPLGTYTAENISCREGTLLAISDMTRPVAALMDTALGEPVAPRSIEMKVQILRGDRQASILQLRLDGRVYRPGETLTGRLIVRPFRHERVELPVTFELPGDLPEGEYTLTACEARQALRALRDEKPQLFEPRTVTELFQTLQRIADVQDDLLYLRLPLQGSGLALGQRELPDLPPSRAAMLSEADLLDTQPFIRSLVRTLPARYVLVGSANAEFEVRQTPREIITRQIKE